MLLIYYGNAWVINLVLNEYKLLHSFISVGRLFQSLADLIK